MNEQRERLILLALITILERMEKQMAAVADITAALTDAQTKLDAINTTVQALHAQGPGITPAELDPVLAAAQGLGNGLATLETSLQALVTPPAP